MHIYFTIPLNNIVCKSVVKLIYFEEPGQLKNELKSASLDLRYHHPMY